MSQRPISIQFLHSHVNLCVVGQDVFVCGFAGALAGALTCGSAILHRNLHLDTIMLAKKTKFVNGKMKGV